MDSYRPVNHYFNFTSCFFFAVGSYTCTVTDASFPGCSISGPVNVDTSAVAVKIDNLELVEISCHNATDGEITVHASGGTPPYTFSINGISNGSDSVFSNLSSNSYTLRVEDNVNCYDELTIIIDNPLPLSIDTILVNPIRCHGESNASIQSIIVNGGTPPYQYSINGGLLDLICLISLIMDQAITPLKLKMKIIVLLLIF